jgi:hypothetical protein
MIFLPVLLPDLHADVDGEALEGGDLALELALHLLVALLQALVTQEAPSTPS